MLHCNKTKIIIDNLHSKYQETGDSIGVLFNNLGVFEIYRSNFGETWTAVVHWYNGVSCVIANGYDFQNIIWSLKPSFEGGI